MALINMIKKGMNEIKFIHAFYIGLYLY